jgi:hypothetical protein
MAFSRTAPVLKCYCDSIEIPSLTVHALMNLRSFNENTVNISRRNHSQLFQLLEINCLGDKPQLYVGLPYKSEHITLPFGITN